MRKGMRERASKLMKVMVACIYTSVYIYYDIVRRFQSFFRSAFEGGGIFYSQRTRYLKIFLIFPKITRLNALTFHANDALLTFPARNEKRKM